MKHLDKFDTVFGNAKRCFGNKETVVTMADTLRSYCDVYPLPASASDPIDIIRVAGHYPVLLAMVKSFILRVNKKKATVFLDGLSGTGKCSLSRSNSDRRE
jgi:hypothetical protein